MNTPLSRTAAAATSGLGDFYTHVQTHAEKAGVFGRTEVVRHARFGELLRCEARASAEPAEFRVFADKGKVWVALVTMARWLSQSIEADLVHTGDKMEDLIEEELIEHGLEKMRLSVEHFRDEDKLFTFRSALPFDAHTGDAGEKAGKVLCAYEAAFRPLGDMEADEAD